MCMEYPFKKNPINSLFYTKTLVNPLLYLGIDVGHFLYAAKSELMEAQLTLKPWLSPYPTNIGHHACGHAGTEYMVSSADFYQFSNTPTFGDAPPAQDRVGVLTFKFFLETSRISCQSNITISTHVNMLGILGILATSVITHVIPEFSLMGVCTLTVFVLPQYLL